jgi:hypothetical protein
MNQRFFMASNDQGEQAEWLSEGFTGNTPPNNHSTAKRSFASTVVQGLQFSFQDFSCENPKPAPPSQSRF